MSVTELRAEAAIEFEHLQGVVDELLALRRDVGDRSPTLRETAAAASFLMPIYNGIENLLKRISKYHNVPLPTGKRRHADLFLRFCDPPHRGLPLLFDKPLADRVRPFRTFRHVARTNYGTDLDWTLVAAGIDQIGAVFEDFHVAVTSHLDRLNAA